ncbi:Retrovirus-related Gag-pol Polyprotein [Phytophthora palmivora]|uniref:Retrovirus-related Gag-pol Polyprotein n=1 Tax=Phytophthora palmivora TaxID=4796 RepID=A0A2P4YKR3_9STRA|nr:Retrovirus-related Gag-pol Polyprotein [Phytophthora palmivora]
MDNSEYWSLVGGSLILLTVYMDDIIIANIKLVVSERERKFEVKDLGSVRLLLSMENTYIPGQVMWISQRCHIKKILNRFKMDEYRILPTPQAMGCVPLPATSDQEDTNDPNVPYRYAVRCLQYLVQCIRPELANEVRTLGKYLNKYRTLRWRYEYCGIYVEPWTTKVESSDLHFFAYADADLGNKKDDRYSITGYVLQLNGGTYAYKSRRQRIVTDYTCRAEFVAANKGTYKTKSVDLKYHKVRDYPQRGEFEVRYCPSTDMLADIFTKPLGTNYSVSSDGN